MSLFILPIPKWIERNNALLRAETLRINHDDVAFLLLAAGEGGLLFFLKGEGNEG